MILRLLLVLRGIHFHINIKLLFCTHVFFESSASKNERISSICGMSASLVCQHQDFRKYVYVVCRNDSVAFYYY